MMVLTPFLLISSGIATIPFHISIVCASSAYNLTHFLVLFVLDSHYS